MKSNRHDYYKKKKTYINGGGGFVSSSFVDNLILALKFVSCLKSVNFGQPFYSEQFKEKLNLSCCFR